MTGDRFLISDLEIVGYADVLTGDTVPSVVAPVFRFVDDGVTFLYLPFRIDGETVYGGTLIDFNEYKKIVDHGMATWIDGSIAAKTDYCLFVDQKFRVKYYPSSRIDRLFDRYARIRLGDAECFIKSRNLVAAEECCRDAMVVGRRNLDVLVLVAIIHQLSGDEVGRQLMVECADGLSCSHDEFNKLFVEKYNRLFV